MCAIAKCSARKKLLQIQFLLEKVQEYHSANLAQ